MFRFSMDAVLFLMILCISIATRDTCRCSGNSDVASKCFFRLLIQLTLLQCLVALASTLTSSPTSVARPAFTFPHTSARPDN